MSEASRKKWCWVLRMPCLLTMIAITTNHLSKAGVDEISEDELDFTLASLFKHICALIVRV